MLSASMSVDSNNFAQWFENHLPWRDSDIDSNSTHVKLSLYDACFDTCSKATLTTGDVLQCTRFLVLVDETDSATLHCGLLAHEYFHPISRRYRIYIRSVDTTGHNCRSKGPWTRLLVQSYIHTQIDSNNSPLSIHWFSCAQPALLFEKSESNKHKRVLSSFELTCWWLRILSDTDNPVRRRIHVPNSHFASKLQSIIPQHWECSLPFDPTDLAHEVIPSFPDDPITLRLQEMKQGTTVKQLFYGLEMRLEFKNGASGYFVIEKTTEAEASPQIDNIVNIESNLGDWETFRKEILNKRKFASEEDLAESSKLVLNYFESKNVPEVKLNLTVPLKEPKVSIIPTNSTPATVNVLQVKRKAHTLLNHVDKITKVE